MKFFLFVETFQIFGAFLEVCRLDFDNVRPVSQVKIPSVSKLTLLKILQNFVFEKFPIPKSMSNFRFCNGRFAFDKTKFVRTQEEFVSPAVLLTLVLYTFAVDSYHDCD